MDDTSTETIDFLIEDPRTGNTKVVRKPKIVEEGAAYNVIKDPETGDETWVKDPTCRSIAYTSEQLKIWVSEGQIPPELGARALRNLEKTEESIKKWKELKDASDAEKLAWLKSQAKDIDETRKDVEVVNFLLDHKDELLRFFREHPKKKSKFRKSGQFVDQTLKYSPINDRQPSLFDHLSVETKDKIDASKIDVKTAGIQLTPPEEKLVTAICKLLADKSETHDTNSERFYAGNVQGQIIPYGGAKQEARAAYLRIKPTELYKEYLGEENYSGKDIKNIRTILTNLSQKKYLIVYERKRKNEKGENRTDRIEEFQSLISIITYIEDLTDAEVKKLDGTNGDDVREQKGELVIAINPLITDQIKTKYVEYPTDINQRTVTASGGHRQVTESILALRDYLLRELSSGRYKPQINADKLQHQLKLENYVRGHRKKLIQERIERAIEACRNLGLLLNAETQTGAEGQVKYVFTINQEYLE